MAALVHSGIMSSALQLTALRDREPQQQPGSVWSGAEDILCPDVRYVEGLLTVSTTSFST